MKCLISVTEIFLYMSVRYVWPYYDVWLQELEVLEGVGPGRNKKKTAIKQAHRKTFYVACQEAGLGSLAGKFGLTPEQFGENLRDNYQRHETEQYSVEPEEVAQDYVQPSGSAEDTLSTVLHDVEQYEH